jgi:hypothetical protein
MMIKLWLIVFLFSWSLLQLVHGIFGNLLVNMLLKAMDAQFVMASEGKNPEIFCSVFAPQGRGWFYCVEQMQLKHYRGGKSGV